MAFSLCTQAHSEIGLVRKNNQDSGYFSPTMLLVADGMGGAAAGDLASTVAVKAIEKADRRLQGEAMLEALAGTLAKANDQLADLVAHNHRLEGMGTTVTGVMFDGEQLGMVHIGDSRGYRLRDGKLEQLTRDHSWVQSLVDEGKISEEEAATHPHRSLLLKVLNGQPTHTPDVEMVDVHLANVGFQIRSTSGVALKFERVGTAYRPAVDGTETLYTDANGSITINGLAYGSYDVVETEALAGYVSIAPERITLSAEKAQVELTLVNEQTVLEIHKTDPYNKPMAGIGFNILDANGKRLTFVKTNGIYTLSANGLALVQTDENGLIVIHGLPLGEYTLEETVTPSAYVAIAPRSFTISDGSTAAKPHIEKVVNQLAPTPPPTDPTPAPTDPTETDPSGNEGEGIGPTDPSGPTTPGVNKPPLTGDLGGNWILFLLVGLAAAFVFGGLALWLHERKLSKRHDHR